VAEVGNIRLRRGEGTSTTTALAALSHLQRPRSEISDASGLINRRKGDTIMAVETKVEVEGAGPFSTLASLMLSVLAVSPIGPFGHFSAKATDTETGENGIRAWPDREGSRDRCSQQVGEI
jgi:hypothetical protein